MFLCFVCFVGWLGVFLLLVFCCFFVGFFVCFVFLILQNETFLGGMKCCLEKYNLLVVSFNIKLVSMLLYGFYMLLGSKTAWA